MIQYLTINDGIPAQGTFIPNGKYPLTSANFIKGGLQHFNTIQERDTISALRVTVGMLAYVYENDTYYKLCVDESSQLYWEKFGDKNAVINELSEKVALIENKLAVKTAVFDKVTRIEILFEEGKNIFFHLCGKSKGLINPSHVHLHNDRLTLFFDFPTSGFLNYLII